MPREKHAASQRRSNIELLRIIVMFIIVANHFALHSGFVFPDDVLSVNRLWIQLILCSGGAFVDVFVLISGYFLIKTQSLKTARVIKLWAQLFFYSVLFYAVFVLAGAEPLHIKQMVQHLIPVASGRWWFASAYFMLYLLTPYLNRLLNALDQRQYAGILLLLGICWCLFPTLTGQMMQSNHLLWFCFLYALGGYLQRFGVRARVSGRQYLLLALAVAAATYAAVILLDVLGTKNPYFAARALYLREIQMLPMLLMAVFLFLGISRLDIGHSRVINFISPAMFGVYLIHDNQFVRPFLWKTVFQNASYADSNLLIPHTLFATVLVFLGCTLIELLRIHLLEARCLPLFERIAAAIDRKKDWILDKLPGEK